MNAILNQDRRAIAELVNGAVRQLLSEQDPPVTVAVDETMCLSGTMGLIDSLDLVRLLIELEQRMDGEYGISVAVLSEGITSQQPSPFRTIGSLVDYLCLLVATWRDETLARTT
jgi:acyl carrier protein